MTPLLYQRSANPDEPSMYKVFLIVFSTWLPSFQHGTVTAQATAYEMPDDFFATCLHRLGEVKKSEGDTVPARGACVFQDGMGPPDVYSEGLKIKAHLIVFSSWSPDSEGHSGCNNRSWNH
jgi:hypothetical protein